MTIDINAAIAFNACNARILDRRRLLLFMGEDAPSGVLAALDAHRNDDGGYGWALEPDLRSPESQPAAAMHAFEVLAEIQASTAAVPAASTRAVELCDWLAACAVESGAVPFAWPLTDPAGSAPWWGGPDSTAPSLHMSTAVAGQAYRVARGDPSVARHPWLREVTDWCLERIAALTTPTSHEVLFSLRFLDGVAETDERALPLIDALGTAIPADGIMPVTGGIEGEVFHPLDFAPEPQRPVRRLFTAEAIEADLDRLAAEQQTDGGWDVNFKSASPAGALEWRGYATTAAVMVLRQNGRKSQRAPR
jgi:hypothetical protein